MKDDRKCKYISDIICSYHTEHECNNGDCPFAKGEIYCQTESFESEAGLDWLEDIHYEWMLAVGECY